MYKLFFTSALLTTSLSLQAASLEHTLNQELQSQLPLSGIGIEADVSSDKVILSGSALNLSDRTMAEAVIKRLTQLSVVNEIRIDDAYLRDAF
ncbi:MAG: BON domain-containing protein [Sulfurimonadaceae bacterium]|nr:BON domain-containing protein [Sulfurimonadaceae bacterium]